MAWFHLFNAFSISRFGRRKRQQLRRRFSSATRPVVEQIERRVLLSVNPTIALDPNSVKPDGTVDEGSAITVDLTPPDSEQDAPDGLWHLNFGDGKSETFSGDTPSDLHFYSAGPNDYTVSGTYTDSSSNSSSADSPFTIHVNDVPPKVYLSDADSETNNDYNQADSSGFYGGPAQAIEGQPFNLSVSAYDPGGDAYGPSTGATIPL